MVLHPKTELHKGLSLDLVPKICTLMVNSLEKMVY